ncbi:hypothetical protein [Bdellovibrio sp.]|uniref:hypothetical protein n=1 Tax=Bdellovibrio sp. TaxID=28201 RepID=UPI0039E529C8
MRFSAVLLVALMVTGQASFAGGKSEAKKFHKMCREENPGASKALIKKCVKDKVKEAKAK